MNPVRLTRVVLLAACAVTSARADDWVVRQWRQPRPEEQLAAIRHPLPQGQGAVFVPVMTDPDAEPAYSVLRGGSLVGTAQPGSRLVLPPGNYQVRLGSSRHEGARLRPVSVQAGETTLVEVDWSGLVVQVLNENGFPFRGLYEIVKLPEREYVGAGYGARIELGQRLETWILEPGLYLLLRRGESYQARANFFTVLLRPGYLERLALVMSEEDGSFRGAGDLQAVIGQGTELEEDLVVNWVVGAGAGLDFRRNVPGAADVTEFVPSLFTDFTLSYSPKPHLVYTRFKLDEEFTQEDWGVYEEEFDLVRFDALYSYFLASYLGPYVRTGMETNLFPNHLRLAEERDFVDVDDPGNPLTRADDLRIADPFFPLTIKGGAGLRLDAKWSSLLDLWVLVGAGGRQVFNRGVWADVDDPETGAYEVQQKKDTGDLGAEATLFLELAPVRWLMATAEFEVFLPFGALDDPTFRLELEADLRLTSVVGLAYSLKLMRQPAMAEDIQQIHSVALRFSVAIF